MKKREYDRVSIIQHCLEQDVLPRLLFDMPIPRSERTRGALRVVTNYVAALIRGNREYLKENKVPLKRKR